MDAQNIGLMEHRLRELSENISIKEQKYRLIVDECQKISDKIDENTKIAADLEARRKQTAIKLAKDQKEAKKEENNLIKIQREVEKAKQNLNGLEAKAKQKDDDILGFTKSADDIKARNDARIQAELKKMEEHKQDSRKELLGLEVKMNQIEEKLKLGLRKLADITAMRKSIALEIEKFNQEKAEIDELHKNTRMKNSQIEKSISEQTMALKKLNEDVEIKAKQRVKLNEELEILKKECLLSREQRDKTQSHLISLLENGAKAGVDERTLLEITKKEDEKIIAQYRSSAPGKVTYKIEHDNPASTI